VGLYPLFPFWAKAVAAGGWEWNSDNGSIRQLVEPVLTDMGYELVELQLRNEKIGLVLKLSCTGRALVLTTVQR
jgi:hypothetical protein